MVLNFPPRQSWLLVMEFEPQPLQIDLSLPTELNNCRLLAAVSGGADSVAMLLALHDLRQERSVDLIAAHLNHGLRATEADADADWVKELCTRLSIPCVVECVDAARTAKEQGATVEEAARDLRYDFFKRTAQANGCRFVAVAHTANDQVETVLHHIIRGTGLNGLQGIPPRRLLDAMSDGSEIELVRPLLETSRDEVEEFLHKRGQHFRQDQSNVDQRFTRNRIRNQLLPLLREQFNPQVDQALLRLSRQANEAQRTLNDIADEVLSRAIREETPAVCRLDVQLLQNETEAVIRTVMVRLWQRIGWPRQKMGFREWTRLAELVFDESVIAVTLPGGFDARRRGGLFVLRSPASAE